MFRRLNGAEREECQAAAAAAERALTASPAALRLERPPTVGRRTELHVHAGGAQDPDQLEEHPLAERRAHLLVAAYLPCMTHTVDPANVELVLRRLYAYLQFELGFGLQEQALADALARVRGYRYVYGRCQMMQAFHLHWPEPASSSEEQLPAYVKDG